MTRHIDESISKAKVWREYLGLTQQQVAERMGISQAALSKLEKQKRPRRATWKGSPKPSASAWNSCEGKRDSKAQVELMRRVNINLVIKPLGLVPPDLMEQLEQRLREHPAL